MRGNEGGSRLVLIVASGIEVSHDQGILRQIPRGEIQDEIENWEDYIDTIVESISANSGRSCINTSTVVPSSMWTVRAIM